jgi:hypothetical protein
MPRELRDLGKETTMGISRVRSVVVLVGGSALALAALACASDRGAGATYTAAGRTNAVGGAGNGGGAGGSPGAGGSSGTGGTLSPTGGSATGGTATGGTGGAANPHYVWAPWEGYVWATVSGASSTITTNFDSPTFPDGYCVTGTVAHEAATYNGAILALNLNQAAGSSTLGTWSPSSTSGLVCIRVLNPGNSPLLLVLQSPRNTDDGRWCRALPSPLPVGFWCMPLNSFNGTACGGSFANAYAGEDLQAIMVVVAGNTTSDVPFAFCVDGMQWDPLTP